MSMKGEKCLGHWQKAVKGTSRAEKYSFGLREEKSTFLKGANGAKGVVAL